MANPKTLTTEECCDLLRSIRSNYITAPQERKCIRNYTIALLMLDAGLRVGEVVHLRISDLLFNSVPVTSIIIRSEIAKNKTERIIPVSERLSNAIKKMLESYWSAADQFVNYWAIGSLNASTHLTTRQVERIIKAAAMKSLGRPIHPHILRHTFGTRIERKAGIRVAQELLGHKNLSSTQIYTHPNQDDLKKAIDSLPAIQEAGCYDSFLSAPDTDRPNRPDTPRTDRDMG
ncbi:Tyrosine recombinase XerC [subsurface metagenome]